MKKKIFQNKNHFLFDPDFFPLYILSQNSGFLFEKLVYNNIILCVCLRGKILFIIKEESGEHFKFWHS